MNATEKEQSHRVRFFYIFQTARAQRPRRSQRRGNGGRQRNGAGMEKHSQESNQQSKLESATGPFSNINTQLMPPPKKSESTIQKYSCKNSSSGGYLLLSPVPASTRYFNKSLFNKRNES